jgi:energy-coupling factor transporter transmembrane protein EcfT
VIPTASDVWSARRPWAASPLHPAVRLAAVLLLIASTMMAGPWPLLGLALVAAAGLRTVGLRWSRLPGVVAPWLWLVAGVFVIHAVTATDVAPLGRPTWTGLGRGLLILGRLAVVLGFVAVAGRLFPLDDLVAALAWWLRPLRPLGVDATHLGLAVAVALGTVPRVRAEGQRLLACQRLRQPPSRRTPWRWLALRLRVIPPLIDGLMRRAESVPLVVAWRLPADAPSITSPPAWQWAPLTAWLVVLVWLA